MRALAMTVALALSWVSFLVEGMERYEDRTKHSVFSFVKGKSLKGKIVEKRNFTSPLECSHRCRRHALCSSFNYKLSGVGSGSVCELNNATRITSPNLYQDDPWYSYYFDPRVENFKSCLDYLRNGANDSGIYIITDISGDSYQVLCDLKSETGSAWTLIQSYALKNRREPTFCLGSFASDLPVNENSPNWSSYRLNLKRMKLLTGQSTHWRSTTEFEKLGVDYIDYVRGKISSFDILSSTTIHGACKTVELVNIRRHTAKNTQVNFYQQINVFPLHSDSMFSLCPFNSILGAVPSENNFGFYCEGDITMNSKFRGTINEDSTTQWWFGGYL